MKKTCLHSPGSSEPHMYPQGLFCAYRFPELTVKPSSIQISLTFWLRSNTITWDRRGFSLKGWSPQVPANGEMPRELATAWKRVLLFSRGLLKFMRVRSAGGWVWEEGAVSSSNGIPHRWYSLNCALVSFSFLSRSYIVCNKDRNTNLSRTMEYILYLIHRNFWKQNNF